jgi:uncharacterized protein YbcC (UPF0753/DUF2309 family)
MTNVAALRIRDDVALAAQVVAPSWPLSSIIAVNPIAGFEDRPFEQALIDASLLFATRGLLTLPEYRAAHAAGRIPDHQLDAAIERYVAGLGATNRGSLDAEQLGWLRLDLLAGPDEPAPARLLRTVAEAHDAEHGTHLRRALDLELADACARWCTASAPGEEAESLWDLWRADHHHLDDDHAVAMLDAMEALRVPHYAQRAYLERHLSALPGWAAHLRWRVDHGSPLALEHLLAAAVTREAALLTEAGDGATWFHDDGPVPRPTTTSLTDRAAAVADAAARASGAPAGLDAVAAVLDLLPGTARALVWQDAYERSVHDPLLAGIAAGDGVEPTTAAGPADELLAQVVCCIDVRSEGLRRQIESVGGPGRYQTFGYAGFFGLFARIEPVTGGEGADQCPVLVTPTITLQEVAPDGSQQAVAQEIDRREQVAAADDAWRAAKYHPIAPLALAEGAGWLAGPVAALRTARLWPSKRRATAAAPDTSTLPVDQRAGIVAAVLQLGIAPAPAPLVVLCGHTSHADNNPMESGLACGACAGHGGAPNARAVAAMANDPEVRAALTAKGLAIPATTWFLAAEHDTSTDRVALLDRHLVPAELAGHLAQLEADLAAAGDAATADRLGQLPGAPRTIAQARRRTRDWAEPVVELGLAGNHAFVIGPRRLTQHLDLGRRAFLHSYEADRDPDGTTLAGILTAPLVVGQWISAQYHLSTTDPDQFGSGTKVVHNVLGDVGVLSGPGGDLRRGLPLQSVRDGGRLLHEPVRLLAVVQGRLEHIDAAIEGSATLRQLVHHRWIHLVARAHDGEPWRQRHDLGWALRPHGLSHEHEQPGAA